MVLKSRGLGVDGILYTTGIWYRKRPQVETMPEQLSDVGKEEGNTSIIKIFMVDEERTRKSWQWRKMHWSWSIIRNLVRSMPSMLPAGTSMSQFIRKLSYHWVAFTTLDRYTNDTAPGHCSTTLRRSKLLADAKAALFQRHYSRGDSRQQHTRHKIKKWREPSVILLGCIVVEDTGRKQARSNNNAPSTHPNKKPTS